MHHSGRTGAGGAADVPPCELQEYPFGHFDIYDGPGFDAVLAGQRAFLARHVPAGVS